MASGGLSRNDPCPCGSGKKYKQCCLRASGQTESGSGQSAAAPHGQLVQAARAHHRAGRVTAAVPLYQEALRARPEDAEVLEHYGQALSEVGRVEEAAERLTQATRLDPSRARAHAMLASVLLKMGRRDDALAGAKRAVELAPDDRFGLVTLAECAVGLGLHDDAERSLRHAVELAPEDAFCAVFLARVERLQGRIDAARPRLEEILAREQVRPLFRVEAMDELANILVEEGDPEAARDLRSRADAERARLPRALRR